jgi:small-conductance mechanosensitive channel
MSSMKAQTSKQAGEKEPQAPLTNQSTETAAPNKSARQARPSFDDLQVRITTRAYELYVERGSRDGCALEDWLDAEREILSLEFIA